MQILAINVGSNFRWSVIQMPEETKIAGGVAPIDDHTFAQRGPEGWGALLEASKGVEYVVHRFVHGGTLFRNAARIDDKVQKQLEELQKLDPWHQPRELAALSAAKRALPKLKHFACFDTAFHTTMPPQAAIYPVPQKWTRDYGIRRHGFHGLSVNHALRRAAELTGKFPARLVVCHLGSTSSITAINQGHSVDTTMGFTSLDGVPMNTRSGAIDTGVLLHLMKVHGLSVAEVEDGLEHSSGLKALFGGTGDLHEVLAADDRGDPGAALAYGVFVSGLRRGLGGMLAALNGLDALAFTGGLGEHQPRLRQDLMAHFAWMGLKIDPARNAVARGDCLISPDGAPVPILRVEAREDLVMARQVFGILALQRKAAEEREKRKKKI